MEEDKKTVYHYKNCHINWQLDKWLVSHRTHTIILGAFKSVEDAKAFIDDYIGHHILEDGIGGGEFQNLDDGCKWEKEK